MAINDVIDRKETTKGVCDYQRPRGHSCPLPVGLCAILSSSEQNPKYQPFPGQYQWVVDPDFGD